MRRANYVYDSLGRLLQANRWAAMPDGVATSRPISITAGYALNDLKPDGGFTDGGVWIGTRYSYDKLGRVTQVTDDLGAKGLIEYDGLGRVVQVEGAELQTGRYKFELWYDSNSNIIETKRTDVATTVGTNAETFKATHFYDSLNRLVTTVDSSGRTSDFRYNSVGLRVASSDSNGPVNNRSVNRRGDTQESVTINGYGNAILTKYDGVGRVRRIDRIMTSTGKGNGVRVGADWYGRALSMFPDTSQCHDGLITIIYGYDINGPLKSITDDNGNQTRYVYDNMNQMLEEASGYNLFQGLIDVMDVPTTTIYRYDADGNIVQVEEPDGSVVDFVLDEGNRIIEAQTTPSSTSITASTRQSFEFDSFGQLVSAIDFNCPDLQDDVLSEFAYDSTGRTVEESLQYGTMPKQFTSRHYNSMLLDTLIYPSGKQYSFAYHDNKMIREITDGLGAEISIGFEHIGDRELIQSLPNGVTKDFRDSNSTHYDTAGRPSYLRYYKGGVAQTAANYKYDRVGNKIFEHFLHQPEFSKRYSYDSAYHLRSYVVGEVADFVSDFCDQPTTTPGGQFVQGEIWEYDGVNNRRFEKTMNDGVWSSNTFSINNHNEYTSSTIDFWEHGEKGLLQRNSNNSYKWDAQDRLRTVLDDRGTTLVEYVYDAFGAKVATITSDSQRIYLHDGWRTIEEIDESSIIRSRYVYGESETDERLILYNDKNSNSQFEANEIHSYQLDALQSVLSINDSSGNIFESYQYDPFGTVNIFDQSKNQKSVTSLNSYFFTGRRWDTQAQIYDFRSRHYSPDSGRFLQRDRIGIWGDLLETGNGYAYTGNNPQNLVDPYGYNAMIIGVTGEYRDNVINGFNNLSDHTLYLLMTSSPDSGLARMHGDLYDFLNQPKCIQATYEFYWRAIKAHRDALAAIKFLEEFTMAGLSFVPGVGFAIAADDIHTSVENSQGAIAIVNGALMVGGVAVKAGKLWTIWRDSKAGKAALKGKSWIEQRRMRLDFMSRFNQAVRKSATLCLATGTIVWTKTHTPVLIENIAVGDSLLTSNHHNLDTASFSKQSYLRINLIHRNDPSVFMQLIRSDKWVADNELCLGRYIKLQFSSMELDEYYKVAGLAPVKFTPCVGTVTGITSRISGNLMEIKIKGEVIKCTPDHLFFLQDENTWTMASDLKEGNALKSYGGHEFVIDSNSCKSRGRVYSLEVLGEHTFFIGASKILTHNTCPKQIAMPIIKKNFDRFINHGEYTCNSCAKAIIKEFRKEGHKYDLIDMKVTRGGRQVITAGIDHNKYGNITNNGGALCCRTRD